MTNEAREKKSLRTIRSGKRSKAEEGEADGWRRKRVRWDRKEEVGRHRLWVKKTSVNLIPVRGVHRFTLDTLFHRFLLLNYRVKCHCINLSPSYSHTKWSLYLSKYFILDNYIFTFIFIWRRKDKMCKKTLLIRHRKIRFNNLIFLDNTMQQNKT